MKKKSFVLYPTLQLAFIYLNWIFFVIEILYTDKALLYVTYLSVVVDSEFGVHTKALIVEAGLPLRGSGGRD